MEEVTKDVQEVQETLDEVEETTEEALTPEEIAELKKNAEVSSQNYERAKKAETKAKALEEEKTKLEAQLASSDDYSDDDNKVTEQIASLTSKLNQMEEEKSWSQVLTDYPAIKDKRQEFDDFLEEYKGLPLQKVAKLFVVENELDVKTEKRKGLEKAGGGVRVEPSNGKMSGEDVKRLRETNYKKYKELLLAGKIKLD